MTEEELETIKRNCKNKAYKNGYIRGIQKGRENPSDELIDKIANLTLKWCKYMSQTFGDTDNKESCLSYIKNNWDEN